jgi:hypothetical protein
MRFVSWAYMTSTHVRLRSYRSLGGGEEGGQKSPRSCRRRSRLDPRTPSSENVVTPHVAIVLIEYASLLLRGLGSKEGHSLKQCPIGAHVSLLEFITPSILRRLLSNTCTIAPNPPVPSTYGLC